jgi:hypothetical protein
MADGTLVGPFRTTDPEYFVLIETIDEMNTAAIANTQSKSNYVNIQVPQWNENQGRPGCPPVPTKPKKQVVLDPVFDADGVLQIGVVTEVDFSPALPDVTPFNIKPGASVMGGGPQAT